ncbi:MAG TPA: hypothetical protein P5042_06150 [Candidatus Izemoplasmatales bacterium]|nr:hypothetical protein [Candidatus Izemoplasmatales bacterium]
MASPKIKLAVLTANRTDIDSALVSFAALHCFSPVDAGRFVDLVHGLSALSDDNPCPTILGAVADLEKKYSLNIQAEAAGLSKDKPDEIRSKISEIRDNLATLAKDKTDQAADLSKYEEAAKQVKNLEDLDVSLDDVFSCDYVYARVGRLPSDSVGKLEFYQDKPFIFKSFSVDNNYNWCMYFTSKEYEREVDNIFSSLFFERSYIPDFVHGTPRQAYKILMAKKKKAAGLLEAATAKMDKYLAEATRKLAASKAELLFLDRVYSARKYVVVMGGKIAISGFVRAKDVALLSEEIGKNRKLDLEIMPADSDARLNPPSKLKQEDFF